MDDHLRRLDRRAPDLRVDVQRLQALRRAGTLSSRALTLRAYFGEPAARAAAPDAPSPAGARLEATLRGLAVFGKPTLVRAALALARPACARLVAIVTDEPRVPAALDAVEAWLADPCEPRRVASLLAGEAAHAAAEALGVACFGPELEEASWCAFAVANAAKAAGELQDEAVPELVVETLRCATDEDDGAAEDRLRGQVLEALLAAEAAG